MAECCDDITRVKEQVSNLYSWKDTYERQAQEWRNNHESKQDASMTRIFSKLDDIVSDLSKRPPLWTTALIGVLCSIVGALVGVIAVLSR